MTPAQQPPEELDVRNADGSGNERVVADMSQPFFQIQQRDDPDGALRVTLIGEIDTVAADQLTARLKQLTHPDRPVRLDLSQPGFMDCSGVGAIINILTDARRAGWELDVDRRVSPSVAWIIALAGVASVLWPVQDAADACPC
jgi:anti-anti-sigma factor